MSLVENLYRSIYRYIDGKNLKGAFRFANNLNRLFDQGTVCYVKNSFIKFLHLFPSLRATPEVHYRV